MWDYDTREVGGGGGGSRGEVGRPPGETWGRRGEGWWEDRRAARSELKAERRKCQLANSWASAPKRVPAAGASAARLRTGSPHPWSLRCPSFVLGRQLPGCGGRRWTLLQVSVLRRIPARNAALRTRTRRASPLSPLQSVPPGFLDLSCLFSFTEDVKHAHWERRPFDLER